MGLFNQDEGDEEEIQRLAPDFSGREPGEPDMERDVPSPVEPAVQQETPQAGAVDDAAAYGQPVASSDENPYHPISPPAPVSLSPYADHSADYAAMQSQKEAEKGENVKPSVLRRIVAGLAGGAITFGSRDSSKGMAAIDAINGAPLENAQGRWARAEAPIQSKIANDQAQDAATRNQNATAEQQGRLNEQDYRNQSLSQQNNARARYFAAQAAGRRNAITQFTPDDPSNPYAGGTGVTADGRTQKGVAPPDAWVQRWIKTPQGQQATQQMTLQQRGAAADQIGLKGRDRQYFLANGKLAQPTEHTTVSIREGSGGNGQPKTQGMTQAQKTTIINQRDVGMREAQRMPDPKDQVAAMQAAQDGYEQKLGMDPETDPNHRIIGPDFKWTVRGEQGQGAPAQAAPQQQASSPLVQQPQAFQYKGQTFTPGQTVMVNGKPAVIKGLNAQTGKLIVGAQ